MHIPVHIPIGNKSAVVARAAVWRLVNCEQCHERYACQIELSAIGRDVNLLFMDSAASAERARNQALEHLKKQERNALVPIPCPHCGNYQPEMARQLKENAWVNKTQIIGGGIALASLVFLAIPIDYIWIATIVIAAVGLAVVAHGYVSAYRYNPNGGDPEPRKALARAHAVWGQQLEELIAAAQIPNSAPAPDDADTA